MNTKTIILITFVLLGILTLGAASAADDVASDNMTSTDLGEDDLSDTPANNDEMLSISDNDDNLGIEEEPILSKATPTINVDVDDGYYGQDISLNVELESDATGNITLHVDEETYHETLVGGRTNFILSNLSVDLHNYSVSYPGDENYDGAGTGGCFNVFKATPEIAMLVNGSMLAGDPIVVSVTVSNNATGNLSVYIGEKVEAGYVSDGIINFIFENMTAGSYNAIATYSGNENYTERNTTMMFDICKRVPSISMDNVTVPYGGTATIVVTLDSEATGNITLFVDGKPFSRPVSAGAMGFNISGLSGGAYDVVAIYSGDSIYEAMNATATLTILQTEPTMEIDVLPAMVYGEETTIYVTLSCNVTDYITLTIADTNITVEITNGKGKHVDSKLAAGIHNVTARYYGNENYTAVTNSTMFEIAKANMTGNVTCKESITVEENGTVLSVTYADLENGTFGDFTIMAIAPNDFTGNVSVRIGDMIYNRPVPSFLELNKLLAGNYTVNVTFYGDNNYNNKTYIANLEVLRVTPIMAVNINDITYPDNAIIEAVISNSANGTVKIYLDSVLIKSADITDGILNTSISGVSGGMHNALIIFESEDYYNNNVNVSKSFTVNPANTTITLTNNGTNVTAILTGAGSPLASSEITFYINGMVYYRTTDSEGKATVEEVLGYGNYTITATYLENENYYGAYCDLQCYIMNPTSFEALQQLINDASPGETISLTSNYTYNEESDSAFIDGIIIDKYLTINGNGHVISGNDTARIFNVINDALLTLADVTLTKGNATQGGAVYVNSGAALNVNHVIFTNNTAVNCGGAIYSEGTVDVNDSDFIENDLINRDDNNGGAAIFNLDGTLTIDNSRFTSNIKNFKGRGEGERHIGAVTTSFDTTITNSNFTDNKGIYGGAITVEPCGNKTTGTITIENCAFKDNVGYNGGAIWAGYGDYDITISNTWFENNTAVGFGTEGYTSAGGAAIITHTGNGIVNIKDSIFKDNTAEIGASPQGGAICIQSSITNIGSCVFEDNESPRGGAVYIDESTVNIAKSNFTDNRADSNGGSAIYLSSGTLSLNQNTIASDMAEIVISNGNVNSYVTIMDNQTVIHPNFNEVLLYANITDDNGNIIQYRNIKFLIAGEEINTDYNNASKLYQTRYMPTIPGEYIVSMNCNANDIKTATLVFVNSFASLKSLIDNASPGEVITLNSDYVFNNDLDSSLKEGIVIDKTLTVKGNGYTISADGKARIFKLQSNGISLENITFMNGYSTGDGGSISISATNVNISYCVFINSTSKNGGAIYVNGHDIQITSSYFSKSQSTASGGAIYLYGNNAQITSSHFTNSKSTSDGGALYVRGDNVRITDSDFNSSITTSSSSSGGAMSINGANVQIISSNFCNSISSRGGAIDWSCRGENNLIEDCTFVNNAVRTGSHFGGALSLGYSVNSYIIINNSAFTNNTANRGGAITGLNDHTAILNSNFTYNTAVKQGGAIRGEISNVKSLLIYNSIFKYNNCTTGNGGAITLKNRFTTIDSCTFIGNEASYAGSISLKETDCSNTVINNCNFIDSYAFDDANCSEHGGGGAIACWASDPYGSVDKVSNITITNSNFTNCRSRIYGGGAIEYLTSNGIMENLTFTRCSAPYGGALSYASHDNVINNLKFVDCSSSGKGGSIFMGEVLIYGNKKTIEYTPSDSSLTNIAITNSQAGSGGAIYIENGKNINISYLRVDNSKAVKVSAPTGNPNGTLGSAMPDYILSNNGSYYGGDFNFGPTNITVIIYQSNGGAIYIENGTNIHISDLTAINSRANNGGTIFIDENSTNILISNAKISNSNTTSNGGAIYVDGDNCNITNSNFTSNNANNKGGSIYWAGDYGILTSASFDGSSATESGGAVYWQGNDGTVENSNFLRSSAENGGAIYVEDNKQVLLKQSSFDRNHATTGSAIYGGTHKDCVFSENDNIVVYPIEQLDTTTIIGINSYYITLDDTVSIFFDVSSKNGGVDGCVDLYINEELYKTVNINEVVQFTPKTATIHSIYAQFNGDEFYLASKSATKQITVNKKTPQVIVSYNDIALGENETISVTLPDDATGNVNITLFKNNEIIDNYNTNNSHIVKTQYSNLNFGVYTVNVKYSDDPRYKEFSRNVKFVVRPEVFITQNVMKGGDVTIFADLIDDTGSVLIRLNNIPLQVVTIKDNKINYTFSTELIAHGNHTINFEYYGNNFKDENIFNTWDEKTNTFVAKDFELYIAPVPQMILTYAESTPDEANLEVRMEGDAKGTVKFFVDGVESAVVNIVNGIAIFDASMYKNGNYIITWVYSGDDKYASTSGSSTLRVNIIPPRISAGDMKVTYSDGKKYSVTVYDNRGRTVSGTSVTFLINNKAIGSVKTNSKGVASIKISKAPGSYKITSKALGVSATKKLTVAHIISLKKVSVKKSAKSLVLTATLKKVNGKYLKGKKITFKFNGKKFSAKTNKKGVAKLTLKKAVLSKLTAGKKVIYQATYLKDTVKQSVKVKK